MQSGHASQSGGKQLKGSSLSENRTSGPLLTVVTAVFNGSATLETTIQSVLGQTYQNIEYIIIDGGSTDGTLDIIRKYEHAINYWLSEPDRGVYDAFNRACPRITGEWTLFLGAGDQIYDSEVLQRVSATVCSAPCEAELVYGRVSLTDSAGTTVKVLNRPWDQMQGRWRGGRPMLPHHQGIFHRRILLPGIAPFDINYKIVADSKLVYSSLKRVEPVYCDADIARAPIGGVSTSPKHFMSTAHEIIKLNREFGHTNCAHQAWFFLKTVVKSLFGRIGGDAAAKKLIDMYRILTGRKPHWRS